MALTAGKIAANRRVPRNKKPLQNIRYWIETWPEARVGNSAEGTIHVLYWAFEREYNRHGVRNFHGRVTEEEIKKRIGPNGWQKFRQGRREFVLQRRVDGRNVPMKKETA